MKEPAFQRRVTVWVSGLVEMTVLSVSSAAGSLGRLPCRVTTGIINRSDRGLRTAMFGTPGGIVYGIGSSLGSFKRKEVSLVLFLY